MFGAGEFVEYFSVSQNAWIPARVLRATGQGTFDLDCKAGAAPDKIRRAPVAAGYSAATSAQPKAESSQIATASSSSHGRSPRTQPRPKTSARQCVRDESVGNAPVQLLSVQRRGDKWWYEVCPEGARMIEKHGSRRIAVICICGLYRTGKSYILNLLLERVQRGLPLFQVGNTTQACTEGMWLYGSNSSEDNTSPLLAFIDCEGFGSTDSDLGRDAQLMTLCSLLSSVLLLNTKGALSERTFNALSLTCRFAEHIEERGNEASRPALLWLLRDFQLELVDANGRSMSPSEYLEQALHAAPLVGHDVDRGRAAHEVRQSLLRFFGQRKCTTLVRPVVDEVQLQQLETLPYSTLREEFRVGVDQLRRDLMHVCHSNPKAVGGHAIGCASFVALMRQLVTAMNERAVLSVKGAWETIQHNVCGELIDELGGQARAVMHTLASGKQIAGGVQLPLADEALDALLKKQRRDLKAHWNERAVGEENVRQEYWEELEAILESEEGVARNQNVRMGKQLLMGICQSWQAWLDDDNGAWTHAETVLQKFNAAVDRTPAAPLRETVQTLFEATGHRVARERSKLHKQVQQRNLAHSEFAQKASEVEGSLQEERMKSQHLEAELRTLMERSTGLKTECEKYRSAAHKYQMELQQVRETSGVLQETVQSKDAEVQRLKAQLDRALADLETKRGQHSEEFRKQIDMKECVWREGMDYVKAAASKSEAAAIQSDKAARKARWEADHKVREWEHERKWLQDEVRRLGGRIP